MKDNSAIRRFTRQRRLYWLLNFILYYLLKLNIFRSNRIWVYGCWEGKRYDDNSRYLFEHVTKNHTKIRSVWITCDDNVVSTLKKNGYESYNAKSLKGVLIQLKAGVAFFTNGIDDFGKVSFIHGAKVIGLWHGTGMKNVYYMESGKSVGLRANLKRIKDKLYSDIHQDFAIATSDTVARMRAETYGLTMDQLMITGQPRNDVFKKKYRPSDVLKGSALEYNECRYILYMPTYRPFESDVVEGFVQEITHNAVLVDFLIRNNIRFIIKLHYLTQLDLSDVSCPFIPLKNEDVSSVQELLAISDCLITDYSGCCIDFALQHRTIILYSPDYEDYCQQQGIKEEWYDAYTKYSCTEVDAVVNEIMSVMEGHERLEICNFINSIYENDDLKDTNYSENVFQAVMKKIR